MDSAEQLFGERTEVVTLLVKALLFRGSVSQNIDGVVHAE
jgi:hypothetical protein